MNVTTQLNGKPVPRGVATSAVLGGLAAVLIAVCWAAFWGGLTVSILWDWFVADVFGVPALSVAQAYGIVLIWRAASGLRPVRFHCYRRKS